MWSNLSGPAELALTRPHRVSVRVSAITATQGTLVDLPILDGQVQVSAGQIVRRSCSLSVDPALWPASAFDPLSPISSELVCEYGIGTAAGFEWVPVFRGPVQSAKRGLTVGAVAITAAGREQAVAEDRLDAPSQTTAGASTVAEITRLITETLPGATVRDLTGSTRTAAQITIDRERWRDGVEKLADSIGAEVYADPTGAFVIRPQPTLAGPPVWVIQAGEGGTLVDGDEELTRERTYNRVVAEGARSDGTAPVRAVVSDTNPASPTLYGGPFGKRPRFYSSPLITTVQQATDTAAALLARATGLSSTITLRAVPHPGLESGDLIEARLPDGRRQLHIVDGFNVPLRVGQAQSITSRSVDLPAESGG